MKSKGFTLVEIIAAIVILSVIIAIAAPNMAGLGNNNRRKMFCTKVENIESAAKLYGEDHMTVVESSPNKTKTMKVVDLINKGYYKKESDSCVASNDSNPCVTDPRTKDMMDNDTVTLTIKNKRIVATFNYKGDDKAACENN